MDNPNLLHKLFQCIHHSLWYCSPPPQYRDPPLPHNMDLDDSFEVDFQWLRRWAALKAHQTTYLFVERMPLIAFVCNLIAFIHVIYGNKSSPICFSLCHVRNLTWDLNNLHQTWLKASKACSLLLISTATNNHGFPWSVKPRVLSLMLTQTHGGPPCSTFQLKLFPSLSLLSLYLV